MGFVGVLRAGTPDSFDNSLHLKGTEFNWAISITYFMVTVLLIPSNLLMKKFSGKRYFPVIMIGFGTVVCCIAAVQNAAGLLTARFFLGIPESGVVPASIMYFSFWYLPSERALRIGIFHAANSLASGVGGFIAVGVDRINSAGGLESWRWVFIIEGLMAIAMSVPIYFLLLTFPETSTALTERERHIAINRFGRGATRYTDVTCKSCPGALPRQYELC
jgi:MFS family permease